MKSMWTMVMSKTLPPFTPRECVPFVGVEKTSEKGELLADDVVTGADLEDFRLLLEEIDAGCAEMEIDHPACAYPVCEGGVKQARLAEAY